MTTSTQNARIHLPWRRGLGATRVPVTKLVAPREGHDQAVTGAIPLGWRPRAVEEVAESWRRQVLLVRVGSTTVRIQARLEWDGYGGVAGDQGEAAWPLAGEVLIAGAVRGPVPLLVQEHESSRDAMRSQAQTHLVRTAPAALVHRGHAWAEHAVIATGLTTTRDLQPGWQERFLDQCRRMGITTVVRVRDGQWQVLTLSGGAGDEVAILSTDPCSVTRDVERRCVLLPAPASGEYCRMRGGPWISRSIAAAMAWKSHRAQLVDAVGCDTCEGVRYLFQGVVREGGGPIGLVPLPLPNRWLVADEKRPRMEGWVDA